MCVILFYLTYISKYKTNLSNYSIYRTLYSIKANEQKGCILCFLFRYLSWIFYIFSQHRLCLAADLISPTLHPAQPSSQKEEKQSERMQDNTELKDNTEPCLCFPPDALQGLGCLRFISVEPFWNTPLQIWLCHTLIVTLQLTNSGHYRAKEQLVHIWNKTVAGNRDPPEFWFLPGEFLMLKVKKKNQRDSEKQNNDLNKCEIRCNLKLQFDPLSGIFLL